jgi:hypothetical protein
LRGSARTRAWSLPFGRRDEALATLTRRVPDPNVADSLKKKKKKTLKKNRCGLVTQALNMLPVGQIDGGRVTQTGFGRRALGATSLGVYLGLSLGVIASSLSLSWGLYVLICQRTPEFSPQDDVTEVSPERQQVALLLIFLAIMVLLPGVDVNAASQDVMPML